MRKIVWMSLVVMGITIGSVSAQEVPTECGGFYSGGGSCTFRCRQGDSIAISGWAYLVHLPSGCEDIPECFGIDLNIFLRASCGGVSLECSAGGCMPSCEQTSRETASSDDEEGICVVRDSGTCGVFRCRSVTPKEAAELEASGQGIVFKIPEK